MELPMRRDSLGLICTIAAFFALTSIAPAQPQIAATLTREEAVRQALQHNPQLATVRQQQGYAAAALIIARTYPYNPVYTGYVAHNSGPQNADITNRVYLEHYVSLEIELRGQKNHRRALGCATVSRIEWEIAQQEIAVSVAVLRAYNALLYRQAKLQYLQEGIKVGDLSLSQLKKNVDAGKGTATDLMLARVDFDSARAQLGQARTTLTMARSEMRRLLGTLDDSFAVSGSLDVSLPSTDQTALTQLALGQRPDLHARRAAINEAEASLRLLKANRYGNPSLAPFFEYDPTRVTTVGGRISMPLAIFNTKKGEILKAETDVAKIRSEVQQLELQASQDVQAALARLKDASQWADSYRADVLPGLLKIKAEMDKQFAGADPKLDFARFLTVQRTFIKANENLLDARYEVSQAQADLALALAEPALAIGPPPTAALKK
jgi:outer membrane protein TolC